MTDVKEDRTETQGKAQQLGPEGDMRARVIPFPTRRAAATLDDGECAWLREEAVRWARKQGLAQPEAQVSDRESIKAELKKILEGIDRRRAAAPPDPHVEMLRLLRRIDRRLSKIAGA